MKIPRISICWQFKNAFAWSIGFNVINRRWGAELSWVFRPDAQPGEYRWRRRLCIYLPRIELIRRHGRVVGIAAFGRHRIWR